MGTCASLECTKEPKKKQNKKMSDYTDEELQIEMNQRYIRKMNEGIDLILEGLKLLKEIELDKQILEDIYRKYK